MYPRYRLLGTLMSLEKPCQDKRKRVYGTTRQGWTEAQIMLRLQYLLLEVAYGILVSVSEEIQNVVFNVVLLQVVHQVGAVTLQQETKHTKI